MKNNMQVFVFFAEGVEEIEAITIVDILRRSKINVITISITDKKKVIGSHDIPIITDKLFFETDFSCGEMLILPGGINGTNNLNNHLGLKKLLKQYNTEGKKIAAICAAPLILGELNLLHKTKATVYPGFEDKLLGAIYVQDNVIKDNNIITGKGPAFVFKFALLIVTELKGKKKADEIAEGMLLNI